MSDVFSRDVVIECVYKALRTPPLEGDLTDTMSLAIRMVNDLPPTQPVLTCKGCKYDHYECVQCLNCLRKERDLYEPE